MNKEREIYLFIKNSNRSDNKFLGDYFNQLFSAYALKKKTLKEYGIKLPYELLKKINFSYRELMILLGYFNISFDEFIKSFYNYIHDKDFMEPLTVSINQNMELIEFSRNMKININDLFRFLFKFKGITFSTLAGDLEVDERRFREELVNNKKMNIGLVLMLNKKFNLTFDDLKQQYDLYLKFNE
jgi:hypothetical protein